MANTITGSIDHVSLGLVKATIDGITFEKILKNNKLATQAIGVATKPNANVWTVGGTTANWSPSVQAVDIDWNGAKPDIGETSDGITTTGELLTLIKKYADTTVKNSLIGESTNASTADTIWGAKNYADVVKNSLIGTPYDESSTDTIWGAKVHADEGDTMLIGKSTDASSANTIWGAKNYAYEIRTASYAQADTAAGNVLGEDGNKWPNQKTVYGVAKYVDTTVKDNLIGTPTDASTANTIWGAKVYVDENYYLLIGESNDEAIVNTIWGAKNYAVEKDSKLEKKLIGASTDASTADTIWGAKKYTDEKISELKARVDSLQSALQTLSQNVGSLVTITNGE